MIGVFDSGHGGLTVFEALVRRFPQYSWLYYGDHANAPYGNKSGPEVVELTQAATAKLYMAGCKLVVLGCNTATAVAARTLQTEWLPEVNKRRPGHRLLGIIAPTVEAVTQTPWHVNTPVFPQSYNTDVVALFATAVTVNSGVYETELAKRCPRMRLVSQACPSLVSLIEAGAPEADLKDAVFGYVRELLTKAPEAPHSAILGCTHYPLVAHLFKAALPASTRLFSQPDIVANALEDYISRHPEVAPKGSPYVQYTTSGNPAEVSVIASRLLGMPVNFVGF